MNILLYIDPGTGSMLFTILIGLIGAGLYSARMLMVKVKFLLSGGKAVADKGDRIPYAIFPIIKDIGISLNPYAGNSIKEE